MAGDSQSPHPREWRVLFRTAIFETNDHEMVKKISDAEEAIANRMHELFGKTGPDVEEEREALDDATYALRAWKIAARQQTSRGLRAIS